MVAPFLALAWSGTSDRRAAALQFAHEAQRDHKLDVCLDGTGLLLMTNPRQVRLIGEAEGAIVGSIYPRDDRKGASLLINSTHDQTRSSLGRHLIDHYWGTYVAFVRGGDDRLHVVRDPSGMLPCYRIEQDGLTLLASDLELFPASARARADIDWHAVLQLLAYPHLRGTPTGLTGIDEVPAGCQLRLDGGTGQYEALWSPWTFTRAGLRITDFEEAAAGLREVIVRSVRALATPYTKVLLELSGGLDSSILASALATAGIGAVGLNLATREAEGDERPYARRMATRAGMQLIERQPLELDGIDMTRPPRPRLARPGAQAWLQGWEHRFVETARAEGCDVFFSGTGGDNVFCSLFSGAPAADLLRTGRWTGFPSAVGALATVHDASLWRVAGLAMRSALRRAPSCPWPSDTRFLVNPERLGPPDPQAWLDAPRRVLPGTRAHVRSIMATYGHQGGSSRERVAPSITPLLAQPVQEYCLRIPSWLWVQGGRDRAVARHAFRDQLPPEILHRRSKGSIDSYCLQLYERNRTALREMLVEGHLVAQGLLDGSQLRAYFDQPRPARDVSYFRLLSLVDVEIWARDWLGSP
jgi:asparagine synthase (glutamine-hydrolysing)